MAVEDDVVALAVEVAEPLTDDTDDTVELVIVLDAPHRLCPWGVAIARTESARMQTVERCDSMVLDGKNSTGRLMAWDAVLQLLVSSPSLY